MAVMEPEKFLTLTEFNTLRKAAKDDRERCILLLLAGAGLRVGEMTQIKAEDINFNTGYLHVQATNDLQDQLGHASLVTTGIYLKASPNHRREAYMRSRLSSFLTGEKFEMLGQT